MAKTLKRILEKHSVKASAPCRIDIGGTLDIGTFYFPLRHLSPCTVNIAINLTTQVMLLPYAEGKIRITSQGFKSAEYPLGSAPFSHPLGLMFIEKISYTKRFSDAIVAGDLNRAMDSMNKETAIRQKMTPEVLYPVGGMLVKRAIQSKCGARFTDAGGRGCVWALGYPENIDRLKNRWRAVFDQHPSAYLLDAGIDSKGLLVETAKER